MLTDGESVGAQPTDGRPTAEQELAPRGPSSTKVDIGWQAASMVLCDPRCLPMVSDTKHVFDCVVNTAAVALDYCINDHIRQ